MTEIDLISLAKKGDLFAFNDLVDVYSGLVYNVCYRVTLNKQDAEDATQEAFITAFQKLDQFSGDSFKSWLLRIATNKSIDMVRKRRKHPEVDLEPINMDGEENPNAEWMIDPEADIDQIMDRADLSEILRLCIQKLGVDQRVVIVLVDVFEMGYEEVSKVIKKPLGTIKSRLIRAREKVKSCVSVARELFGRGDRHIGEEA